MKVPLKRFSNYAKDITEMFIIESDNFELASLYSAVSIWKDSNIGHAGTLSDHAEIM